MSITATIESRSHRGLLPSTSADSPSPGGQTALKTADSYGLQALKALELGDLLRCVTLCESALEVQPQHYEALHVLAQALLMSGRPADCLTVTAKILAEHPADAVALNNTGVALDGLNRLEEAVEYYLLSSQADPKFQDPMQNRALALDKLGQHAKAESVFRELIESFPEHADAHYGLGNALCNQKRTAEAIPSFRKAVELQPNFGLTWFNLGNALLEEKQWSEAIEAFGQASCLIPHHACLLYTSDAADE